MRTANALVLGLICALTPTAARADWGENWGEMAWGVSASPVPALPAVWLLLAGLVTGAALVLLVQRRPRIAALLTALALVPPMAAQAGVTVPHIFVMGTVADADEVNANFSVLEGFTNLFGGGNPGTSTSVTTPGHCASRVLGEVWLYAGNHAPQGTLQANGQILNIAQHSSLFSVLGPQWGGDGATTFALPNMADVAPDGVSYVICMDGVFPMRN